MMRSLFPDEYKVDLEVFEGPLDLLLYLIRKNELDIYDIPIDLITGQYMRYLGLMKMLDLDLAGEFIVMASTLSLIKSRMLLPEEDRDGGEDAGDIEKDPRWDLVKQLLAYKRIKDASEELSRMEDRRQNEFGAFGIMPAEDAAPDGARDLCELSLGDLVAAFREVLVRAAADPVGEIEPVKWTVSDKMSLILGLAYSRGARFSELFAANSPRGEIIVTFLALLELLRMHRISVVQEGYFTEIMIRRARDASGEMPDAV